uniref:Ankyrin repeat domain-containing protein n=1 Tax=Gouania willdenowi TaxID=441366 RepID=A0A8C5ERJ2_GOUWI
MAVSLGHLECVRVLLKHGAEVTKENAKNWTVLQEAVSTGDPEMVQIVLHHRDYLKFSTALGGVPGLLSKIRESPDFYMEMKWEFTSWIPLLSRVCPSDVCRIWKSGACLRVDTTLLDFENMTWIRGHRSYIFRGDDPQAELLEVNHDDQVVETESFNILEEIGEVTFESMVPEKQEIAKRLTTPIVNTYLDTKDIAFERNKSGIWGWRTDRTETVNRFEAKVFSVNNVNIVIRTRTEHLTDEEKAQIKSERNILESLLGTVEEHISAQGYATATNPTAITPEEYFNPNLDLGDRDIGRPIELSVRTQKFKGTLWMSEDHPLSLVEQVTPIIDIMAHTSSHFARLRDFLNLKFPPGFPVKIEIPLFHLLNARITFGKVNECSTEEEVKPTVTNGFFFCIFSGLNGFKVSPSVFQVPLSYQRRGGSRHLSSPSNEEDLLQYAIHQSLLESSRGQGQVWNTSTESILGGALDDYRDTSSPASSPSASSAESELRLAMELSARVQEEEERIQKLEEEQLKRILQLSLTEK